MKKVIIFFVVGIVFLESCSSQNKNIGEKIIGTWIHETSSTEIIAEVVADMVKYGIFTRDEAQRQVQESIDKRGYPEGKFIDKMYEFTANSSTSGIVRYYLFQDENNQLEMHSEGSYTVLKNEISFALIATNPVVTVTFIGTGSIKDDKLIIKIKEMTSEMYGIKETMKRNETSIFFKK